jgi:two-component system, OmpR family, osmolarity sensor histidine kinase EnvZ
MIGSMRLSVGLLGRILTVLLLIVVFEFGASTLLYERSNTFSWREDEAHRLAEHLVIARKLLSERVPAERPEIAEELTTDRYDVSWSPVAPVPVPATSAPGLAEMRREILAWEPSLATTDLRLRMPRFEPQTTVVGGLRLADGTWMHFAATGGIHRWGLAIGRIAIALIPPLILLIIGAITIRRLLQPLHHLARATESIGTGSPVPLREEGTQEVRGLIQAFNAMQSRIHRLVEDRVQALAAVSHDLRTPLARMQLRLDDVRDTPVRAEIAADIAEIDGMIASLLAFIGGEDDPEKPARTDLAVLAATLVDDARDRGGDADYRGPEHLEAEIRPIGIRRALSNLIENALHYGGEAIVTLERGADAIVLMVEDGGPGIPPESLQAVLTPFLRLDAARGRNTKGLGLGLSIVAQAVEREGGQLILSNRPTGGLRAEIILAVRRGNDSLQ